MNKNEIEFEVNKIVQAKHYYYSLLYQLKILTDDQFLEMFHDLEDLELIEHIGNLAIEFAENRRKEIIREEKCEPKGKSDYELYREQDNAMRVREGGII